jgi:predicted phosphodiesterase
MRALVISDIHSNLPALEAVLAAAPPQDTVWNLGDTVGYGANPNEVVNLVRKLGGIVVRGNHDRICAGNAKFGEYRDLSQLALFAANWTQKTLSAENTRWLLRLPLGSLRPLGRKVACVHGSPWDEDEYMIQGRCLGGFSDESRSHHLFWPYTQAGWLVEKEGETDSSETGLRTRLRRPIRTSVEGKQSLSLEPRVRGPAS